MNLRFLRTFVAIADNAGFARAAARLNLTQSAASRQIQALEDELGLRLFARIGRSVRLTREGEDLLVRSRQLLFDAEALGQRASALKTGEVGVLRVGATPQVIESLLADFLLRYRKPIWWRTVAPACRAAWSAATLMSPSCRPAKIASPAGCSIRCTSWPWWRRATGWAVVLCSMLRNSSTNRCCASIQPSHRMAGSRLPARLRIFDPACCSKAWRRRR